MLGSGPGRPGGLLPQGSHRSVRALSGIRLVTLWIRCPSHDPSALRGHAWRFDALGVVPASGPQRGTPFARRGSGGPVPPLPLYYEVLRLPAVLLDPFQFFTSRYHRVARDSLPAAGGVPPGARQLSVPVSPSGIAMETSGALRFLDNPDGHCPCSTTPVGP